MTETLLDIVYRHTKPSVAPDGVAAMACGPIAIRSATPTALEHTLPRPLLCLVLQGRKRVSIGNKQLIFAAGDSMVVTANQPMVSQIIQASARTPYLSVALDLDLSIIADLVLEMQNQEPGLAHRDISTDAEVADAVLRLMRLLDRPAALPLLQKQLLREIHFWLLSGRHGGEIRRLGLTDSHVHRIARAVAVLRTEFAESLPVERLASLAGMSRSSFHQHFRAVTSLTPLQFQKQLRLIEARRLIMEGKSSSRAAFDVGYEGASHFARDYSRMFGLAPSKDRAAARNHAANAGDGVK
ncbi:AraC family transcriptional regulator [Halopseudomonas laoshanensis]|uniref:AraC family transcriptional regulator n=1 Tax=Halopseudomonas laoshanensis TaxID=2268758 RepID=A0A7V7GWI2_9GAMM|nr:AraC family transcriptional regulator [Halopseudomonas laoshanensis]KAA0696503.1 AraC family transcriptional regulator [Halopseudomonas laoshanensis]